MNRRTSRHADRRSVALERLESITVGAAIAGVAGIAGFGALAAITFSGTATAADPPSTPNVSTDRSGSDDDVFAPIRPNDEGGEPFVAPQAPRTSSGRGHATTGGSG